MKVGTTLSFSASTDQKYTVIDNKLHPPVGKHKPPQPSQSKPQNKPQPQIQTKNRLPNLPSGIENILIERCPKPIIRSLIVTHWNSECRNMDFLNVILKSTWH